MPASRPVRLATTPGGCRSNPWKSTDWSSRPPPAARVLYFQGVPILASPILGFPIGDQRRSGFLTPSFGLSTTLGTDIRTPFYWNIAPNYDYTITPRVMTKRGALLGNEFRFLAADIQRHAALRRHPVRPADRRQHATTPAYGSTIRRPRAWPRASTTTACRTTTTSSTFRARSSARRRRCCRRTGSSPTRRPTGTPRSG